LKVETCPNLKEHESGYSLLGQGSFHRRPEHQRLLNYSRLFSGGNIFTKMPTGHNCVQPGCEGTPEGIPYFVAHNVQNAYF
jgi:hypothetical protein